VPPEPAALTLVGITLLAATVNGGLGYGFSSLTVPVAVLFYANRALNPALVLVELVVNTYSLLVNRESVPRVWRRTLPIMGGLLPGVLVGSLLLSSISTSNIKVLTYAVLLPLILLQAAGFRRYIKAEKAVGVPLGAGIGILYSVTTISGPPLALMLNNQGYVREEFRASLALIRIAESSLTAVAYLFLGLYTSFDAWVVGFGFSRTLIDLGVLGDPVGYIILATAAAIDLVLLYQFFSLRRYAMVAAASVTPGTSRSRS
jgi:uncharacterized membrane protein YfcA